MYANSCMNLWVTRLHALYKLCLIMCCPFKVHVHFTTLEDIATCNRVNEGMKKCLTTLII